MAGFKTEANSVKFGHFFPLKKRKGKETHPLTHLSHRACWSHFGLLQLATCASSLSAVPSCCKGEERRPATGPASPTLCRVAALPLDAALAPDSVPCTESFLSNLCPPSPWTGWRSSSSLRDGKRRSTWPLPGVPSTPPAWLRYLWWPTMASPR